ncbi:BTB/POZ fold domain-containing protein [Strongyloides ratti]|uniref:BTB/POZ fold domain-containing protein n=1 Tax=Strongyloides ratti TaxID=34506 RepID=A0A090LMU5_STRRB|nr:BTB/POZ fold domain-containing protein [Strongyloides ratti]CEF68845.1 BTB/POZ fold domain-containing protein [Strongyloides ratti]
MSNCLYNNLINGNNIPLQNDKIINKYNSDVDVPYHNDIILQCQETYFRLNYNVGIVNSKLLQAWSKKIGTSGFTVHLNDCKKEAIKIVLNLFQNSNANVSETHILDVYRVLVKLECTFLEKKFHNYINQSILMRTNKNNNQLYLSNNIPNSKTFDIKNSDSSSLRLKKLSLEIKDLQKVINNFIKEKNYNAQFEKKSLKELPDVVMSDKVIDTKFLTGKKILYYKDYQEIFDILDFYKSKTSFDQIKIPSPEYNNFKLIIDNEVYEIKCLLDLKNVAKYIKRIYNKYENKASLNNVNMIKKKDTLLKIFPTTNSRNSNKNKLMDDKKNLFISFNKEKQLNNNEKPVSITIKPYNISHKNNYEERSEPSYASTIQMNTIHETTPYEMRNIHNNQEKNNNINVGFNHSYYALSTQVSTGSNSQGKTFSYDDVNKKKSKKFFPEINYYKEN